MQEYENYAQVVMYISWEDIIENNLILIISEKA